MPMRPLVGRGYAPDTRAVSEAVAPMVNACDPRTKVRTKSRRGRSPDLRDPSPPFAMPMRPLVGRGYAARTSVVSGTSVSVRVDLGGRRSLKHTRHHTPY